MPHRRFSPLPTCTSASVVLQAGLAQGPSSLGLPPGRRSTNSLAGIPPARCFALCLASSASAILSLPAISRPYPRKHGWHKVLHLPSRLFAWPPPSRHSLTGVGLRYSPFLLWFQMCCWQELHKRVSHRPLYDISGSFVLPAGFGHILRVFRGRLVRRGGTLSRSESLSSGTPLFFLFSNVIATKSASRGLPVVSIHCVWACSVAGWVFADVAAV